MTCDDLDIRATSDGIRFEVHVVPRASRDAIVGVLDRALKVSLTAPPVDGAANKALQKLLAKRLGVAKSALRIVRGDHGRRKTIEVTGMEPESARAALTR